MSCMALLPLEVWLPFFVEGTDTFESVLGSHGDVVGLDGQRHARLQIGLAAPVDGLLGLAYGDGSVGGDGGGNLESLSAGLARRDEMIHEAKRLRLRGGDAPAREDHLLGERRTDDARQELRAPNAGEDAERHLGHGEDRSLRGHDEVGEYGELTAPAHGKALHGGDDGYRAAHEARGGCFENHVLRAP